MVLSKKASHSSGALVTLELWLLAPPTKLGRCRHRAADPLLPHPLGQGP